MESLLFLMAGAVLFWYFSTRKEPASRARIVRDRLKRMGSTSCASCGHGNEYHNPGTSSTMSCSYPGDPTRHGQCLCVGFQ
jgi:hypothetical protein